MAAETPETEETAPSSAELAAVPGADSFAPVVDAILGGLALGLEPGGLVGGDYRIERRIGAGGMGEVYLARDLRLDRDVAIKIGLAVTDTALRRLRREALALARLSHPNVVVVHEVGEVGGRVFLAMEHVAGGDARAWITGAPRTWREIIALYAAAGDGLAAAHAAGLVHRDFKPDNVLVGADGRPRVADFGIAREHDAGPDDPDARAVIGTPAYMPPEQHAGGDVDARADQFAFCAATWEALFGARPFSGRTPTEVGASIAAGPPRAAAARTRGVPAHVVAALRRGLRVDRDERWPSMGALLDELRRDPGARRRRIALAVTVVASIAAAALVPVLLRHDADPCADAGAPIASTWSPDRAAAIDRALHPRLDRWAAGWVDARRAACRATRVDGSQSEALLDRRNLCLERARVQVDAIVGALADRAAATDADELLALLPALDACANVANLSAQTPLPSDPAARDRIEAAQRELGAADVHTIVHDLKGDAPRALADRLIATARATGWPPIVAEAMRLRGALLLQVDRRDDGIAALEDASSLAIAAGDEDTAARALADLAWSLRDADRHAEARRVAHLAEGMWHHLGEPGDLGVRVLMAEANVAFATGDDAVGLDAARRAAALADRQFDDAYNRSATHYNLAVAYLDADHLTDAAREIDLARELRRAAFGPDSPVVANAERVAAVIATKQGRAEDAVALARHVADVRARWFGDRSREHAEALSTLGVAQTSAGHLDDAAITLAHALALHHALDPAGEPAANDEGNLAVIEAQRGHLDVALDHGQRANAALAAILGADNPRLADGLLLVGYCLRGLDRAAESVDALSRAVALIEHARGPAHPTIVNLRVELSYSLVAAHRADDAVAALAPAVAVAEHDPDVPPPAAAEAHLALAKALVAAHRDPAGARAAAADARDGYAALGAPYAAQRDEADAWLRAHDQK